MTMNECGGPGRRMDRRREPIRSSLCFPAVTLLIAAADYRMLEAHHEGVVMSQMRIDAYEVLYSANGFSPRIALKNAGNYIGQLLFLPNGAALPADTVVNKQAQLHYHLEDFQNVIDLLRNEKPIYMYYNGSGSGFENGVRTMNEKVGEGEILQQD
jgi:hypothetical protein